MRPKSLVLLGLALGCGLIASIGISQVMDRRGDTKQSVDSAPIYVAKVDINVGDPINAEMVQLQEWPRDKIPAAAIRELVELEDRRPRTKIFAGELILDGKLLDPGQTVDPTISIPKGFRVVPISVKADTGAAGLLRPGDRVDVQWYVAKNRTLGIDQTKTVTILHNVRVFAIDQTVERQVDGEEAPILAKTISLLVDPLQANKLTLANRLGEVSLIPRHPDDDGAADAAEFNFDDLVNPGGSKNSREDEQGRAEESELLVETQPETGGLLSLFSKAKEAFANAQPVIPPFEMVIVEGSEEPRIVMFTPDGKPIRGSLGANDNAFVHENTDVAAGGLDAGGLPGIGMPDGLDLDPAGAVDLESGGDFPIDFGAE